MLKWILGSLGLIASAQATAAVEFRFAPPDGLECDQYYKSRVIKDLGVAAPRRADATESVTHLKFEKVAQGYRVTATTQSGQMTRDGNAVDDPITKVLIGREIVMDIGSDGVLLEVHGYDEFLKDLMATLPPDAQKALAGTLNAEVLRNREIAEWNGRIAAFVGKTVNEGDVWESEDEFTLPTGPVRFTSLTEFSRIDVRAGRPMVTINFAYAADGDAARKMMETVRQGLSGLGAEVPSILSEPTIHGGGERIIDASTMTIEREKLNRVISAPFDMPDGSRAVMTRTEDKEYVFKCRQ